VTLLVLGMAQEQSAKRRITCDLGSPRQVPGAARLGLREAEELPRAPVGVRPYPPVQRLEQAVDERRRRGHTTDVSTRRATLRRVFRRFVGISLLGPAIALLVFGAVADAAWFDRHVAIPALNPPPPSWTLFALRTAAGLTGLVLAACATAAWRRATPGGVARVGLAVVLAIGASEVALRVLRFPVPATRIEARLAASDPRTGWAFVPHRTVDLPAPGGRVIRYAIDTRGDRAPSAEWLEDPEAPTILLAGESIATGHGLNWSDTIPARLSDLAHTQVVDVAEGGYGSDQAHMRAVSALSRFVRPLAVVTLVLPVQLFRNLHDDRPHLVLRDGTLILSPASSSATRLRQMLVNDLPYLSENSLKESLALTRAILHATAAAARVRGAHPLFVLPSTGPRRPLDAHPEAFVVHALLDDLPHVVVDVPPAHMLTWDPGHPNAEGARQIASAIAEALPAAHR